MLSRWLAVGVAAVAVAAFPSACATQHLFAPPCAATAGAGRTALQREQAVNATTIAAVGARMGVPDHGVTIALATALQESKLRNLSSGDRDSVGLFQQRPSQGWGPRASLLDPRFATTAFYEHLLKIDGWQGLAVTEAAQQVQHSAAPSAYAAWEGPARVIAQALTGEVTAGLSCRVSHPGSRPGLGTAVGAELGPGAIGAPVSAARGWLVTSWLVARADIYPIAAVSFAGWRWTATSGRWVADPGATGMVTVTGPTPQLPWRRIGSTTGQVNDAPELDEAAQARLIIELSRDVTTHLDLQQVLNSGLAALRRLFDFGGGAIQLIDDGFLVAAATDPPATTEAMSVRIPLGQGVSGTIASTGEPCYIPDITVDRRVYPDGRARGVSGGVRTYFGVPLILHGMPIGVVQFDSPEVDAFGAAERTLVMAFVPTIAAAVQNAQLFEQEAATLNELREVQRMRSDFLAMVSHELRTPLTTVSGMAQTLAGQIDRLPHDVIADFAHKIVLNSRRLELLIDDLLDLSALDRGELVVMCRPLDLGAIVRQSLADTDLGDHPLTSSIATDLPPVLADERRVRQVLGNLLANARKYSPPGTEIDVRVHADGDRVVVEVADRGSGIPAHLQEKIFEPFFQIEPAMTRHVGGLGAGLNLVRQLCDLMGATISVRSSSPTGSVFTTAFRVEPPDQRRGGR